MSILEVLFIVGIIISTTDEGISSTVDHFWLINNFEVKLKEKLISASLTMVELTGGDEVFQIFIINEHSYRVNDTMNLRASLFKCLDND